MENLKLNLLEISKFPLSSTFRRWKILYSQEAILLSSFLSVHRYLGPSTTLSGVVSQWLHFYQ